MMAPVDAERDRSFPVRHPYLFTALLELAVLTVFILAGAVVQTSGLPDLVLPFAANIILAVVALALLVRFGWLGKVGVTAPLTRRQLALYLVPFALVLYFLALGIEPVKPGLAISYLFMTLLIGFAEEAVYRGLMLQSLLARGIWQAAIISSIVFGLTHGLNALAGSDLPSVLLQLAYSTAVGFAYAALMIRVPVIWPLILVHFLTDFAAFLSTGGVYSEGTSTSDVIESIVVTLVFTAYGLYLLTSRRVRGVSSPTQHPAIDVAEGHSSSRA
ncbi:MAG: CPBP family intramembrane metalloprotease [Chloroflexota bacterium]|nr:CPBP family intramembrane metalloprotease [Chloroflexota bacterium]